MMPDLGKSGNVIEGDSAAQKKVVELVV